MGRKITIDSATLMNKGLEVIEARWLFGVPARADRRRRAPAVDRALDGRIARRVGHCAARASRTCGCRFSTRFRIRSAGTAPVPPLDVTRAGTLEFSPPDVERFPCLRLAYRALEHGGGVAGRAQRRQRGGCRGVPRRARLGFPTFPGSSNGRSKRPTTNSAPRVAWPMFVRPTRGRAGLLGRNHRYATIVVRLP